MGTGAARDRCPEAAARGPRGVAATAGRDGTLQQGKYPGRAVDNRLVSQRLMLLPARNVIATETVGEEALRLTARMRTDFSDSLTSHPLLIAVSFPQKLWITLWIVCLEAVKIR